MPMKKLLSATLLCALLMSSFFLQASASAEDIVRTTATIGGASATLLTIRTGGNRTGEMTIGTGKFYTADTAQNHISRKNAESGSQAVVSVNGGYFDAYSSGLRTYATIVQNGMLVNGGGADKPTLGFTSTGEALIDRVGILPKLKLRGAVDIVPWSVNTWYADPGAVMLFNAMLGATIPIPATSCVVTIRDDTVQSVATGSTTSLGPIAVGTHLLVYNQNAYAAVTSYGAQPKVGNAITMRTEVTARQTARQDKWADVVTAVSAGPMLVLAGKDASGDNPDFKEAKQAPTYVALRAFAAMLQDGRLVLGTSTSSPKQLAAYLLSIGAIDAMSLDGGASTMLHERDAGYLTKAGRNLSNVLHLVEYEDGRLPAARTVGFDASAAKNEPSAWASADIEMAEGLGLLPANLDGAWQTNITRGEFCNLAMKTITKVLGEEELKQRLIATGITYDQLRAALTDTYDIDVLNAYRLGIISGKGNGVFDPHASITRQEAAKILHGLCTLLGIDVTGEAPVFSDVALIATWASPYVSDICKAGIMQGANGNFNPLKFYTRQEAVITMLRLYRHVQD